MHARSLTDTQKKTKKQKKNKKKRQPGNLLPLDAGHSPEHCNLKPSKHSCNHNKQMWYTAPYIRVSYTQAFETQSKQTRPAPSYAQSIAISKQLQQTTPHCRQIRCAASRSEYARSIVISSRHITQLHIVNSRGSAACYTRIDRTYAY